MSQQIKISFTGNDYLVFGGDIESYGKITGLLEQTKAQFITIPGDIAKSHVMINKEKITKVTLEDTPVVKDVTLAQCSITNSKEKK